MKGGYRCVVECEGERGGGESDWGGVKASA